LRYQILINF